MQEEEEGLVGFFFPPPFLSCLHIKLCSRFGSVDMPDIMPGYLGGSVKVEKVEKQERNNDEFAGANFLSLGTGTSGRRSSTTGGGQRVHKDLENNEIDLNWPPVDQQHERGTEESSTGTTTEEEESNSYNNRRRSSAGRAGGGVRGAVEAAAELNYNSRAISSTSKFQETYRGVRHRSELNKWVTEIRPTAHKRKIWLGTYKTPEEAARAYDVGIYYTRKNIPLNFPESIESLPELPEGSWEELAPFVKKQALTAAKRARVQNDLPRTRILPKSIASRG